MAEKMMKRIIQLRLIRKPGILEFIDVPVLFLEEPPAFTQHICHEHHNGWLCKIISLVKDFPIGMLYTQCKILHTQSCVGRKLFVAN